MLVFCFGWSHDFKYGCAHVGLCFTLSVFLTGISNEMGKNNKQAGGRKKANIDRRRHRDEKFDVEKLGRDVASCQIDKGTQCCLTLFKKHTHMCFIANTNSSVDLHNKHSTLNIEDYRKKG